MSSNIIPGVHSYTAIKPFRMWCQKVLPLVYDDSLSYYELLCKLVEYLNKALDDLTNMGQDITALNQAFQELQAYVNNYFDNLDVQEEINNKLDQMVQDGTFAQILTAYTKVRINIAWMVEEPLSNDNIVNAITAANNISKYIYIPAGNFVFSSTITKDVDILLDDGCILESPGTTPVFSAENVSFSLRGGSFRNGTGEGLTMATNDESMGLIYLTNCTNNVLSDITVPYSNFPALITLESCTNTTIENIVATNLLFSCIHIIYHCVNTIVRNCNISNIQIPNKEGVYYCYAVFTGAKLLTDSFTPPDMLIYENNIIQSSQDSGLDTHGASNVIIRNNKILNCNTAITAYNDAGRVTRPEGWVMENVLIENNICESSFLNQYQNHSFTIFNSMGEGITSKNFVLRNNTFVTNNNKDLQAICYFRNTENITLENNTFNGTGYVEYATYFSKCFNCSIINNEFSGITDTDIFLSVATAFIQNNTTNENLIYAPLTTYAYYNQQGYAYRQTTIKYGEVNQDGMISNTFRISRLRDDMSSSITAFTGNVNDNIVTVSSNVFIPGLRMVIDGKYVVYVEKWITSTTFSITGDTVPNGSHSFTVPLAILDKVRKPNTLLTSGADLNTLAPGVYISNSATLTSSLINKPSTLTGVFTLYVDFYGTISNTEGLFQFIISGSNLYTRTKPEGTYNEWYSFSGSAG